MSVYVTDTHPLIWYASNKHGKLSKKAKRRFDQAWDGQALIYVPAVVLWEISLLIKIGELALSEPFNHWAFALLARQGFDLAPLEVEVMDEAMGLTFNDDPFDAAIVATARIKDLPLITKDEDITDAELVNVEW